MMSNFCCSDCFNPKRDTFHRFFDLTPRGEGNNNRRTDMLAKLYDTCLSAELTDVREFKIKIEYFLES